MILPDSIDDWNVGFGAVIHTGPSMMTWWKHIENEWEPILFPGHGSMVALAE